MNIFTRINQFFIARAAARKKADDERHARFQLGITQTLKALFETEQMAPGSIRQADRLFLDGGDLASCLVLIGQGWAKEIPIRHGRSQTLFVRITAQGIFEFHRRLVAMEPNDHPDYHMGFWDAIKGDPLFDGATPHYEAGWRAAWEFKNIFSKWKDKNDA